jgi:hypothetical protein
MVLNDPLDFSQFSGAKTTTVRQTHWVEPEFCPFALSLYMNMTGFSTIIRPKEEAIGPKDERRWHTQPLYLKPNLVYIIITAFALLEIARRQIYQTRHG